MMATAGTLELPTISRQYLDKAPGFASCVLYTPIVTLTNDSFGATGSGHEIFVEAVDITRKQRGRVGVAKNFQRGSIPKLDFFLDKRKSRLLAGQHSRDRDAFVVIV